MMGKSIWILLNKMWSNPQFGIFQFILKISSDHNITLYDRNDYNYIYRFPSFSIYLTKTVEFKRNSAIYFVLERGNEIV